MPSTPTNDRNAAFSAFERATALKEIASDPAPNSPVAAPGPNATLCSAFGFWSVTWTLSGVCAALYDQQGLLANLLRVETEIILVKASSPD